MGILPWWKSRLDHDEKSARQQKQLRFSMTTALQQPSLSSQCMAEFLGTA
ncbi:aquaporin, partial [Bacillus sp. AFS076308]